MDSDDDSYHSKNKFYYPDEISYFLNVKRTRTPGLKIAAVTIQRKNCLQSTLRKKITNTLFAGLGRSVLGETVPSILSTAQSACGHRPYTRPLAQFFPIRTSRPANNIYVFTRENNKLLSQVLRLSLL